LEISPVVSENLAVFPGDTRFRREIAMDYNQGHHMRLSSIQSTLHIGAHADSSGHYHVSGKGVDQRDLDCYIGLCQVIQVDIPKGKRIQVSDLKNKKIMAPRVLFCTNSFPDPNHWNSDFCSLSPDLIKYLHSKKVKLVGIDTPSVDPEDSKALESHQALFETEMAVLEGIILKDVPEGIYFLSALPLRIKDADAAPVRAVLLKI
jgi:arylformamidase